jgi:hypothetical protein
MKLFFKIQWVDKENELQYEYFDTRAAIPIHVGKLKGNTFLNNKTYSTP